MCSNVYFLKYICHIPSPEPEKSFRDTLTDWSRNLPLRSEAWWVDGSNQRKTGDSVHFQVETSDLPYGKPGKPGKLSHSYGSNQHVSWENSRHFDWAIFNSYVKVITGG